MQVRPCLRCLDCTPRLRCLAPSTEQACGPKIWRKSGGLSPNYQPILAWYGIVKQKNKRFEFEPTSHSNSYPYVWAHCEMNMVQPSTRNSVLWGARPGSWGLGLWRSPSPKCTACNGNQKLSQEVWQTLPPFQFHDPMFISDLALQRRTWQFLPFFASSNFNLARFLCDRPTSFEPSSGVKQTSVSTQRLHMTKNTSSEISPGTGKSTCSSMFNKQILIDYPLYRSKEIIFSRRILQCEIRTQPLERHKRVKTQIEQYMSWQHWANLHLQSNQRLSQNLEAPNPGQILWFT